jgi:hypothetical protein
VACRSDVKKFFSGIIASSDNAAASSNFFLHDNTVSQLQTGSKLSSLVHSVTLGRLFVLDRGFLLAATRFRNRHFHAVDVFCSWVIVKPAQSTGRLAIAVALKQLYPYMYGTLKIRLNT